MIVDVMPRAPMRAIQYTGQNADAVVDFGDGAFSWNERRSELRRDDGRGVDTGAWIVEVWKDDRSIFLIMSDEHFQKHWHIYPDALHIDSGMFSSEELEQLRDAVREARNENIPLHVG